jgi:hypothetical protein
VSRYVPLEGIMCVRTLPERGPCAVPVTSSGRQGRLPAGRAPALLTTAGHRGRTALLSSSFSLPPLWAVASLKRLTPSGHAAGAWWNLWPADAALKDEVSRGFGVMARRSAA